MKKLILLSLLIFASCENNQDTEEESCNCRKEIYSITLQSNGFRIWTVKSDPIVERLVGCHTEGRFLTGKTTYVDYYQEVICTKK